MCYTRAYGKNYKTIRTIIAYRSYTHIAINMLPNSCVTTYYNFITPPRGKCFARSNVFENNKLSALHKVRYTLFGWLPVDAQHTLECK